MFSFLVNKNNSNQTAWGISNSGDAVTDEWPFSAKEKEMIYVHQPPTINAHCFSVAPFRFVHLILSLVLRLLQGSFTRLDTEACVRIHLALLHNSGRHAGRTPGVIEERGQYVEPAGSHGRARRSILAEAGTIDRSPVNRVFIVFPVLHELLCSASRY